MSSFWYSLDIVTLISHLAQWIVAIAGILALIFSIRASTLKDAYEINMKKLNDEKSIKLEGELNSAKLEATEARTEAKEAKSKLQPRTLTTKQISALKKEIKLSSKYGMPMGIPIVIATRMMDQESLSYGSQIRDAITNLGWEIGFTELSTHTFKGISIFYNPSSKQSKSYEAVKNAFLKAGIDFSPTSLDVNRTPIQVTDAVYIIIGYK